MTVPAGPRKLALTIHVAVSVGWIGAVVAFLALALTGVTSQDTLLVRASYLAMEPVARYAILPLALATLVTGVVQALGTPWGLFRHYWVVISLVTTAAALLVLWLQLEPISDLAGVAAAGTPTGAGIRAERISLVVHAGGGLLVLLVPLALNIYKPRGLTRYGRRRQREQRGGRVTQLPRPPA